MFVMSGKYDDLIQEFCEQLKGKLPPELPASLIVGDQILSTGRARIEGLGSFWPDSEIKQDIPDRGITLRLMGTSRDIPIKHLRPHFLSTGYPHYHFQLA